MHKPDIAAKSPFAVAVEAGKDYFWCSCGKSKGQPFCDGSHKGSSFSPVKFTASETKLSISVVVSTVKTVRYATARISCFRYKRMLFSVTLLVFKC